MCYRLVVLMLLLLLVMLPMINVFAAPAPEPYAILDIGPPRKGLTVEEFCQEMIRCFTNTRRNGYLGIVGGYVERVKLKLCTVCPGAKVRVPLMAV